MSETNKTLFSKSKLTLNDTVNHVKLVSFIYF